MMWYAVHPIRLWGGSGGVPPLVLIGPLKGLYGPSEAPHKGLIPPPRPGRGSFVPYQAQSSNFRIQQQQNEKREKKNEKD